MKETLAIKGGKPVRSKIMPAIHNVGWRELFAVCKVILKGPLSGFVGTFSPKFFGGDEVLKFEKKFAQKFNCKHAVTFNSATTALHAAIVALSIGPGDEVIVPPYTMSASAMAVLMNGAVPIFADIDEKTFCISPDSIKGKISKRTKAIMVVNLFGQPADFDMILKIAKSNGIKVIEDNAQGPGATFNGKYAGTIGDIGVFSLNIHKTMQTGEGAVLVTNNKDFAFRSQLSRNHGEVIADQMPDYSSGPIIGSNYRMTEVTAAMASAQLDRLDHLTNKRIELVDYLEEKIKNIPGIIIPYKDPRVKHVYYRYVIKVNKKLLGISRDVFVDAMKAEGFSMSKGYVKPIYLLPVFQNRQVFNSTHFPFEYEGYDGEPDYKAGSCPVVERMYEEELTLTDVCQHPYTKKDVDSFVFAMKKVIDNKDQLL